MKSSDALHYHVISIIVTREKEREREREREREAGGEANLLYQ
jgi:hypothetical protein